MFSVSSLQQSLRGHWLARNSNIPLADMLIFARLWTQHSLLNVAAAESSITNRHTSGRLNRLFTDVIYEAMCVFGERIGGPGKTVRFFMYLFCFSLLIDTF